MRIRNGKIKEILSELKNSLNGSFANKDKKTSAVFIGNQDKIFWSQFYNNGTNEVDETYLHECIIGALNNKNETGIALFGKKFVSIKNKKTVPIVLIFDDLGKILILEVGLSMYFAAQFNTKADMEKIGPVMVKTAEQLEEVLYPVKNKE